MKAYKTIRIFISSTFRDMDFERDVIKFKVIPRLNVKYRHAGLTFQAIDLRIGVNTSAIPEDERENKVLDVCLNCIDEARPFFIGLVGSRYGWIPSAKRYDYILHRLAQTKQPLISGAVGRSVTELEILYGAIGENGKYIDNSLFFFRDDASYRGMDSGCAATFIDQNPEYTSRLKLLKAHITSVTDGTSYKPIPYHLDWDASERKFKDTEGTFASQVFNRLSVLIDHSITRHTDVKRWHSLLNDDDNNLINSYIVGSAPRHELVKSLCEQLLDGQRIILTADTGTGKSTLLSLVTRELRTSRQACVLSLYVGANGQSFSPIITLGRWINTFAESLGKPLPFHTESDLDSYKLGELSQMLERMAESSNVPPVILIDGADLIGLHDSEASYLTWLPRNIAFLATTCGDIANVLAVQPDIKTMPLPQLSIADLEQFLSLWEQRNSNELGTEIRQTILHTYGTPRRLGLLMKLIESFSSSDFRNIRNQETSDEMAKITTYVISLISNAPANSIKLIHELLARTVTEYTSPEQLKHAVDLMAISQCGLRDSDIETLLGQDFNLLDYVTITSLFSHLFYDDNVYHKRMIKSRNLTEQYCLQIAHANELYAELVSHAVTLDSNDPLRCDMLTYYLICSGDTKRLVNYVLFAPQDSSVIEEAITYYSTSMQYLLAHSLDFFVEKISSTASELSPNQRVNFLYNVFFRGFPQLSPRLEIIVNFTETIFHVPIDSITSAESAYSLAWMQNEVISALRYLHNTPEHALIQMYTSCLKTFELSNRLDSTIGDSTNLIIAIASQLMTLYAQTGDFDNMNKIINTYLSTI